MVRISTVAATLNRDLLVVDDTRFIVDGKSPSTTLCLDRPIGAWPTAAELDTFLFARGGFPWRCYPSGTLSPAGLFGGYACDTIGTRALQGAGIPLATLGQYRHVLWITDDRAAVNTNPPTDPSSPICALRQMSTPGHQNTLASYVAAGGNLWMVGGGCAYATLIPYNKTNNDNLSPAPGTTFSNANGELVAGRMMYDLAHWRSEIKVGNSSISITRSLGRLEGTGAYLGLPSAMSPKSLAAGDTFPPNRIVNNGNFYRNIFAVEYLSAANSILEDQDPGPGESLVPVLDTLYQATGPTLLPPSLNPVDVTMTYYHGAENTPLIFTGFNIWSFQRVQCKQLVDYVLQQMWGLSPAPAPSLARRQITAWSPRPRNLR
jgi:hypothetical protein